MAEHYSFFDPVEVNGVYDREYNAQEFTDYFGALITTGVMKGAFNMLAVSANGSNMVTSINTGIAFVEAKRYFNDAPLTFTHDTETIGLSRIDRIVIRMDQNVDARHVKAFLKKGTASTNPTPPTLTQNNTVYEISLAQVRIVGGQTFIATNAITDERGKDVICPWASSNILPSFDDNALSAHISDDILHYPFTNGVNAKIYSGDLNNLTSSGCYSANSSTASNLPVANSLSGRPWLIQVIKDKNTSAAFQIASQAVSGNDLYFRSRTIIGSWVGWRKIVDSKQVISGSGSPQGVVTADTGTLYLRELDGTPTTTLYVKTSGNGNTGWTAK